MPSESQPIPKSRYDYKPHPETKKPVKRRAREVQQKMKTPYFIVPMAATGLYLSQSNLSEQKKIKVV